LPIANGDQANSEKRTQLLGLFIDQEAKLKAILTPVQFALYQTKKQKAISYYRGHMFERKIMFNVPND
jgi:hypothetical protein